MEMVGYIVEAFEQKPDLELGEWFGHSVDLGSFVVGSVDIEDMR
jgi:hypothetical protein